MYAVVFWKMVSINYLNLIICSFVSGGPLRSTPSFGVWFSYSWGTDLWWINTDQYNLSNHYSAYEVHIHTDMVFQNCFSVLKGTGNVKIRQNWIFFSHDYNTFVYYMYGKVKNICITINQHAMKVYVKHRDKSPCNFTLTLDAGQQSVSWCWCQNLVLIHLEAIHLSLIKSWIIIFCFHWFYPEPRCASLSV
jgi:hypothetical protein